MFNTSHQLRKAKLHDKVQLTFVTSEPFVGHFGIGGLPGGEKLLTMFLKKENITAIAGVALEEVTGDQIKLTDGTGLPFRYAMVVPPFAGQDVVRATPGLSDDKGYIRSRTPTRPRPTRRSTRPALPRRSWCPGRQPCPSGSP